MSAKHVLHTAAPSQETNKVTEFIQKGMLAHRQGRFADAAKAYEKALKKSPKELAALNLLADAQLNLGKNARALDTARKAIAIKPDMPGTWMVRGTAYRQMGNTDEAISALRKALELKPDYADALMILAGTLREAGQLDAAIDAYEDLIALAPDMSKAHYNLGNALVADGQFDEAIIAYEEAVRLDPAYTPALINLAGALHSDERLDEALEITDRALKAEPASRSARINRGNVLKSMVRMDEAESQYRQLIDDNANDAEAFDLLGTALQGQARLDEAIASYRTALTLEPAVDRYKGDLSTALLANGELAEGWDLYEARFGRQDGLVHRRKIASRVWQGEPLNGKKLLIWREQGIGDDLRFASCFADVIARAEAEGGKVVIETDPRLITLYARSFPGAKIRAEGDLNPGETIDYDIAAGSLPRLFRRSIEQFPGTGAYLTAKQAQTDAYRRELAALGTGLKVGIAWRSRNMASSRRRFYTSLEDWAALFGNENIQLVNLQYDNAAAEIEDANSRLNAGIHTVAGLDLMNDLDGAAALTAAVDIVVSAGTSVADMAGALGKTAYVYGAYRHPMCLGTGNLPWYPATSWVGHRWNEPITNSVDKIVDCVRAAAAKSA
ncbi:MAG: tetratricopeptide repeat protein [Parvibaculaceae bacterium]